jgi:hypothetical protein
MSLDFSLGAPGPGRKIGPVQPHPRLGPTLIKLARSIGGCGIACLPSASLVSALCQFIRMRVGLVDHLLRVMTSYHGFWTIYVPIWSVLRIQNP